MSLFDGKAGETIHLIDKKEIGKDPHNNPIYEDLPPRAIQYVLVAPGQTDDIIESNRPSGVLILFKLHFPKTFDEPLRGKELIVRGQRCKVVGSPEHYDFELTPGHWWTPVEVTASDG